MLVLLVAAALRDELPAVRLGWRMSSRNFITFIVPRPAAGCRAIPAGPSRDGDKASPVKIIVDVHERQSGIADTLAELGAEMRSGRFRLAVTRSAPTRSSSASASSTSTAHAMWNAIESASG